MASEGDVEKGKQNNADENVPEFKDETKEDEKSKGVCGPDMWYSPRGKSCPCVICLILCYIILLPFIIILAFSFALWYCLSTCYYKWFMAGLDSGRVE